MYKLKVFQYCYYANFDLWKLQNWIAHKSNLHYSNRKIEYIVLFKEECKLTCHFKKL